MGHKQSNSYKRMMEHYDDVLTGRKWWSRMYMRLVWKEDGNLWLGRCLISYRTISTDDCLTYPSVLPFSPPESIAE